MTPLFRGLMVIPWRAGLGGLLMLGVVNCATSPRSKSPPKSGRVASFDGLSIAYDVRGHGSTALVFVHCWAGDREFWREQVDAFANDYRIVTVDLGGHGQSGTNRAPWAIADLAKDVQAVVESLRLRRVVLIGHSMGGPVSLIAAERMPSRVIGVVGVDTLQNAEFSIPREVVEGMAQRFETDFAGTMDGMIESMFPESVSTNASVRAWVGAKARATPAGPAVGLIRDFRNVDLRKAFSAVKVPIRCINAVPHGAAGMTTETAINRRYADYDATFLDGVGHYLQLERPDEFNEKLRRVLDEITARAPGR